MKKNKKGGEGEGHVPVLKYIIKKKGNCGC